MNNFKVVNRNDNEVQLFEGSFTLCTLFLTDMKVLIIAFLLVLCLFSSGYWLYSVWQEPTDQEIEFFERHRKRAMGL